MHLITPKYVYPQKVICTPNCLTQGVHVPLNQNVSGNAANSADDTEYSIRSGSDFFFFFFALKTLPHKLNRVV